MDWGPITEVARQIQEEDEDSNSWKNETNSRKIQIIDPLHQDCHLTGLDGSTTARKSNCYKFDGDIDLKEGLDSTIKMLVV